jgi:hypothetical protein
MTQPSIGELPVISQIVLARIQDFRTSFCLVAAYMQGVTDSRRVTRGKPPLDFW